ncbi:T9SS type A sorting domain-containing protein [bacterium]|nr:T9SS type A sorting domain-containing protein [bacterium]
MNRIVILIIVVATACLALPAEIDVRIEVPSRDALRELVNTGLGIDNYKVETGEVFGVVRETDLEALLALEYPLEVLPETDARVLADISKEPSGYPLHSDYLSFMNQIVVDHPVIASLDTFGYSVGGRPLLMMKISDYVAWDEGEPEFCYISTMHGDEPPGMIFLMWFIDSLTDNYGSDPRVTRLVDSCEIYINPLLNPDGYVSRSRYNNNSRDLNRNFAMPDGTEGDYSWSAEIETQAISKWANGRFASNVINFHTGALVANYPWDFTNIRCPDDSLYIFIARNYADRNIPMYNNSSSGFDHGVTNGYDWYEADGTLQDFTYWMRGGLHLTVELGNHKTPPYDSLPDVWDDNYDAYLATIEVCLDHGVHGTVIDSLSGDPIAATLTVNPPSFDFYSSPENGYYHRIHLAGTVDITASAPGYDTKTQSIIIPSTGLARLDFELNSKNPTTIFSADFEVDNGGFVTHSFTPNPQEWEWGEPSLGVVAAHSGQKLWGTTLDGQYSNESKSRLALEDIVLPDADSIVLSFFHWYSFQTPSSDAFHDGGNMKIWTSSSDSTILSPTPGYDDVQSSWNALIPDQLSFADTSFAKQWQEVCCDLTPWRGQTVDISWDFGSSSVNTQVGWYIDDVWIYYSSDTTLLTEESSRLPKHCEISISPNPFNASCKIDLFNTTRGKLKIYDMQGKLVREIPITPNEEQNFTILWNGTDTKGNDLGSGIYFVSSPDRTVNKRIILMK